MLCVSSLVQAFKKVANGPLWFGLPIKSISNSQVVLNVNAASLQLVVNASPGKIMFGQVSSFIHCMSFDVCWRLQHQNTISMPAQANYIHYMPPSSACMSNASPTSVC